MPTIFDLNNAFVYYFFVIYLPTVKENRGVPTSSVSRAKPKTLDDFFKTFVNTDQVTLKFAGDVTYNPPIDVASLQGTPDGFAPVTFRNDTSVQNSSVFRESKTTTASFSTSFTEGIKLGAETKLTTGIPFIAKGEVTLSAEAAFSSTQSNSSTDTQTFSIDTTINVPPKSLVKASLLFNSLQYRGSLTAKVKVTGRVRFDFSGIKTTVEIPDLFKAIKKQKLIGNYTHQVSLESGQAFIPFTPKDRDRFTVNKDEVLYAASATINAKFGASQTVDVKEFDLSSKKMVREYTL